jgi:hypothetical protein
MFNKLAAGSGSCPSPPNTGPCAQLASNHAVMIGNLQNYTFSNSWTASSTVASWNDFNHGQDPTISADRIVPSNSVATGLGAGLGVAFAFLGLVLLRGPRRPGEGARTPSRTKE